MGVKVKQREGSWWVFVDHAGKRKAKKVGADEEVARGVAREIERKIALNEWDMTPKKPLAPTFKVQAELWFKLPHDQKESSLYRYKGILEKHIYPAIGGKRLDEITRKDLKTFLDELMTDKKLSRSTVRCVRAVISNVLNYGVELEVIQTNSLRDIVMKKPKGDIAQADPLKEEEVSLLLKTARTYQHGQYYPLLLTATLTGMRLGELQALQWGDIDFNGRFIEVRRSVRNDKITDTKNHHRRRVDISTEVADTLQAHRVRAVEAALKAGRPDPVWVFADRKGGLFDRKSVGHGFKTLLRQAKLREIRFHDLRHTYATVRLMRGHNVMDVSRQLGHATTSFTLDAYAHWIPGTFKREIDELDTMTQLDATPAQPAPTSKVIHLR
jgi:integrase